MEKCTIEAIYEFLNREFLSQGLNHIYDIELLYTESSSYSICIKRGRRRVLIFILDSKLIVNDHLLRHISLSLYNPDILLELIRLIKNCLSETHKVWYVGDIDTRSQDLGFYWS